MSFNYNARKVRNPSLPMFRRRSALHSCLLRLVGPDGPENGGFIAALERLRNRFGMTRDELPTEQQLSDALTAMEQSRNIHLEKVRAFERKRIREKAKGKRHPSPKDVASLNAGKPLLSAVEPAAEC